MAREYGVDNGDGTITVWVDPEDGSNHYPVRTESTAVNQGLSPPIQQTPSQVDPNAALLEAWLGNAAQQNAYNQAQQAAEMAYRQAQLAGANEAQARNAAISAGSNALSSYVSLLNAYGSGAGLDPNALAEFIMSGGTSGLGLPTGPTLEAQKFQLQQRIAEAEMQANPRNIFKLAAYQSGALNQPGAPTGGGAGGTNEQIANVPFFNELQQRFGSAPSSAFPFAPQTPLPQPNAITQGYYSQMSPFNQQLLNAAYSTAGLSEDVVQRPFQQAAQSFGGTSTPMSSGF